MKFEFEGTLEEFRALIGYGPVLPEPSKKVSSFSAVPEAGPMEALKTHGLPEPTYIPKVPLKAEASPEDRVTMDRLPPLKPENRATTWEYFKSFCVKWVEGFEEEGPQPPRGEMMIELGQGKYPHGVMIMALEAKSLQRLVERALDESGYKPIWTKKWVERTGKDATLKDWQDFYNRVAATMVQVSHVGFPELDGMYDYSQQWRKE